MPSVLGACPTLSSSLVPSLQWGWEGPPRGAPETVADTDASGSQWRREYRKDPKESSDELSVFVGVCLLVCLNLRVLVSPDTSVFLVLGGYLPVRRYSNPTSPDLFPWCRPLPPFTPSGQHTVHMDVKLQASIEIPPGPSILQLQL